jgi:hypothetical protein
MEVDMAMIEVVENPRRHRRRHYTAKQRSYGFGGRRRHYRRRRNEPILASLSGNPRRRSRRRSYGVRHVVYRRRRNPDLFRGFDLMAGVWVGVGAIGSTMIPSFLRRVIPQIPFTGPLVYGVRLGGAWATSFLVNMVTKNRRSANLAFSGGVAMILVDAFREYVAPRLGLSGLGNDQDFVLTRELQDALPTMGGYVDVRSGNGMRGYVQTDYNPAIMGA